MIILCYCYLGSSTTTVNFTIFAKNFIRISYLIWLGIRSYCGSDQVNEQYIDHHYSKIKTCCSLLSTITMRQRQIFSRGTKNIYTLIKIYAKINFSGHFIYCPVFVDYTNKNINKIPMPTASSLYQSFVIVLCI